MVNANLERARESLLEERKELEEAMTTVDAILNILDGNRKRAKPPRRLRTASTMPRGQLTERILELAAEGNFRPNDQYEELGTTKASASQAAQRLLKLGKLRKVRRGTYRTAARRGRPPKAA